MNTTVQRIHRTHYILISDKSIVSFNPINKSIEDMYKGNYTVSLDPPQLYNRPYKNKFGQIVCCESSLVD